MKFCGSPVGFAALASAVNALLASPGFESFGENATGGREGEVHVVSDLNCSGEDAVSAEDRIVVFVVGGLIEIEERMVVSKRVTILGRPLPVME